MDVVARRVEAGYTRTGQLASIGVLGRAQSLTYVASWRGFVYVGFVLDVFARRILRWRVSLAKLHSRVASKLVIVYKLDQMSREALGNFELMVLLAILRVSEDAYGVPIARELEESSGKDVLLGSVYAALDRLEAKGLVCSRLGDPTPERGGRAKKYFKLTAKGVREVRTAQRTLTKLWKGLPALEG